MTLSLSSSMTAAPAHRPAPAITVAFAEYPLPPSSSPSSALPFRPGENQRQRAQDLTGSHRLPSSGPQATAHSADGFRRAVPSDTPCNLRTKVEFAFDAAIVAHSIEVAGTSMDKKTAELEKIAAVLTKWHALVQYTAPHHASGAADTRRLSAQDQAFHEQVLKTMGNGVDIMAELLISPFEDMADDILANGSGSRPANNLINAIRAKLGSERYHQALYEWEMKQDILPNFEQELDALLDKQNLDTIRALAFAACQFQSTANSRPPSGIGQHLRELLVTKCTKRICNGV